MSAGHGTQPGGVVFDCDGVLADTTSCWDAAFCAAAREFGLILGSGQLTELRGAALASAAQRMRAWSPGSPALEEILLVLHEQLVLSIDAAPLALIEGVRDLLAELHGRVRLGVASNSPRGVLLRVLARLDITHYFATAISAEDVARPKPAPDPYLAACEALGVDPRRSFAIEDSQVGIRSAAAAGLAVVELAETPAPSLGLARRPDRALRVRSLTDQRIRPLLLGPATR